MKLRILSKTELINLYTTECRRDFPENELKPLDVVEKLYGEGNYEPIGFFENDTLIAYALQVVRKNGKSVLLDYLAVIPEYRNRGIGSEILSELRMYYKDKCDYIVIESEHPAEAPDESAALRRLDFYKKQGAYLQTPRFDFSIFFSSYLPCPAKALQKLMRLQKWKTITV